MASESTTTTDHNDIRSWMESHGGELAHVGSTGSTGDTGALGLNFSGETGEDSLKPLSRDEWFKKFDAEDLALLYQKQESSDEGSPSSSWSTVGRDGHQ